MKISLSPELERLIEEKVGDGGYPSAEDVVREALALLQQRDQKTSAEDSSEPTDLGELFAKIAASVPDDVWKTVPADLSTNVDQYLYRNQTKS